MTLMEWIDSLKPQNAKGFLNQGHEARDLERLRRMAKRLEALAKRFGADIFVRCSDYTEIEQNCKGCNGPCGLCDEMNQSQP